MCNAVTRIMRILK